MTKFIRITGCFGEPIIFNAAAVRIVAAANKEMREEVKADALAGKKGGEPITLTDDKINSVISASGGDMVVQETVDQLWDMLK